MGKTRQKTHSEVEYLRGVVRELKSEVRNLRKRLKHLEKKEHQFEEIVNDAIENGEIEIKTGKPRCGECGKGEIEETDLKFLIIKKCNICGYEVRTRNS